MPWFIESSKTTPSDTPFNRATLPNPSKLVMPTGEQVFKIYELMGVIPIQTTVFHSMASRSSQPYHNAKGSQFIFKSPRGLSQFQYSVKVQKSLWRPKGIFSLQLPVNSKCKPHTSNTQWHRICTSIPKWRTGSTVRNYWTKTRQKHNSKSCSSLPRVKGIRSLKL